MKRLKQGDSSEASNQHRNRKGLGNGAKSSLESDFFPCIK